MKRLSQLDDAELVDLELRLAERQRNAPPRPLPAGEDIPDETVEALTRPHQVTKELHEVTKELHEVTKEREARMIPRITRRGRKYNVHYEQQTSASAAEYRTDTFTNPEDPEAARQAAITRAVQIGEALRRA